MSQRYLRLETSGDFCSDFGIINQTQIEGKEDVKSESESSDGYLYTHTTKKNFKLGDQVDS